MDIHEPNEPSSEGASTTIAFIERLTLAAVERIPTLAGSRIRLGRWPRPAAQGAVLWREASANPALANRLRIADVYERGKPISLATSRILRYSPA